MEGRLAGNARFVELWHAGAVAGHREDRKVIRHPAIGEITVDGDVLSDCDTDLKIVVHTATPGSEDDTKLQLARVVGAQAGSVRVAAARPRATQAADRSGRLRAAP